MPATGVVLGLLIGLAELSRGAAPAMAAVSVVIVVAYAAVISLLRSRSETAGLLSGLPVDERWESIHMRAMAAAAHILAVVLVAAFVAVEFGGGDAMPYAGIAAVLAATYLGSVAWLRWRS